MVFYLKMTTCSHFIVQRTDPDVFFDYGQKPWARRFSFSWRPLKQTFNKKISRLIEAETTAARTQEAELWLSTPTTSRTDNQQLLTNMADQQGVTEDLFKHKLDYIKDFMKPFQAWHCVPPPQLSERLSPRSTTLWSAKRIERNRGKVTIIHITEIQKTLTCGYRTVGGDLLSVKLDS